MKQATIKTLGVTALGAAFVAAGSGPASAADLSGPLAPVHGVVNGLVQDTAPVQNALFGEGAIGKVPTTPEDVVSKERLAENSSEQGGPLGNLSTDNAGELLGGLPLVGQLTGGGGLPTGGLPLG
ncbi:ATP-binding protein [Streptomyces armeniacus]|uniref:ATP-binding protein n=1 Tax=Streptomyces armeniacus TaxID=83291 RepID=A0A345XWD3_9ACTN|nr:ATP-binding protein [Streptomyces armeniacus]AXK35949.1 ATP-binding protein [Streptomyces armeniacus]